ncbi:MAG: metallophosphoesterase [Thermoproteota archaeon]|nr:metallophosphoesterase [Thermoproteota archaeon]
MFNLRFRKLGFIIGFSAIFLIITSNLMTNHQNFSTAYPTVNKVSFDELSKFSTIPVKGILGDFETSFITTNPNNEEWKNRLCENTNQAGINMGIPLICDSSDSTGQNANNNQQNQDISDRLNETVGNLKEKLDDSIFGNKENDNSQSNDLQSNTKDDNNKNGRDNNNDGNDNNNQNGDDNDDGNNDKENKFSEQQLLDQQGEDKAKSELDDDTNGNNGNNQRNNNNGNNGSNGNNGDSQGNNNDDGLGIAGLDSGLNIDEKLGNVDKKIDNLKNNLGVGQQQENKDNEKNNNDQGNNDGTLGINGLAPNILNIQANLEKQIEKLKDKFENERDNQRLIEQRNEFDDDDDDSDDGDDGSDDGDGKDYDGYGFKGDDDSGNGNENAEENFNFAAAGDFGCSTNTQNTIENMQRRDPEIVLTLGDHSYHSTADCWFDMMSPIKDKLMVTLGHHDVEDGQAKMNQYMNSFAMDKPFYSYDYNKVHFLVMSAKSVYYKGSEQYNFVLEDLKKASENENVNWIVVSSYGPPYTSPSEHTAFKELREVYHPVFEQYGVDLVLSGHNHNYQRTYPLTYNPNDTGEPKVTNTAATDYDGQKDGIVFAIVGTGGVNFYSFNGQAPFVDTQFANKFGFLNIDISNGNPDTKLTGTFYDNKGGQILDQFTIEKDPKNKNTEVINS